MMDVPMPSNFFQQMTSELWQTSREKHFFATRHCPGDKSLGLASEDRQKIGVLSSLFEKSRGMDPEQLGSERTKVKHQQG